MAGRSPATAPIIRAASSRPAQATQPDLGASLENADQHDIRDTDRADKQRDGTEP
jgi:hypothetical protein